VCGSSLCTYFCPLKSAEGAPYADFFFAELLFRISLGRPSFNERKFPFHAVVTTKRMSNVISREPEATSFGFRSRN